MPVPLTTNLNEVDDPNLGPEGVRGMFPGSVADFWP